MTTQKILFEPEITFLASDKLLLDVCNDAHNYWMQKQDFYKLKVKILDKYATKAGIAKQKIKKECYTCDGTGYYHTGDTCYNCTKGIFEIRTYYLQRWVMNGSAYYVPIIYRPATDGPVIDEFEGTIYHEPHKTIQPDFAYAALTCKYDKDAFHKFIIQFQNKLTKLEWKSWGEMSQGKANFIEAFAAWCGLDLQKENTDDLPF